MEGRAHGAEGSKVAEQACCNPVVMCCIGHATLLSCAESGMRPCCRVLPCAASKVLRRRWALFLRPRHPVSAIHVGVVPFKQRSLLEKAPAVRRAHEKVSVSVCPSPFVRFCVNRTPPV